MHVPSPLPRLKEFPRHFVVLGLPSRPPNHLSRPSGPQAAALKPALSQLMQTARTKG